MKMNVNVVSPVFIVQYKKAGADGLMGAMPLSDQGDGVIRYTEKLSPSVNMFLAEASRPDGGRVCESYILTYIRELFNLEYLVCSCNAFTRIVSIVVPTIQIYSQRKLR